MALGAISFNRWTKSALSVSNAIMTLDVLLGVYFAERSSKQPTTIEGLCWDLRCSEQAIRSIVERMKESRLDRPRAGRTGSVGLFQGCAFRPTKSRILDRASGSSKEKSTVLLVPGPSGVFGVTFCAWGRSHA